LFFSKFDDRLYLYLPLAFITLFGNFYQYHLFCDKNKLNPLKGEHEKIDSNADNDVTVSSRYFQLFCFIRYTYTLFSI